MGLLVAMVSIFVAVDPIGVLPLYLSLTEQMDAVQRRRAVVQATVTAMVVAVGFLFLGQAVFQLMGVRVEDFMVAGGVILFVFATVDLVSGRKYTRQVGDVGAVPLGTPLIAGPAVLTTSIMLLGVTSHLIVLAALTANILLASATFMLGGHIERVIGKSGARAASKVANLILAAFAVTMVRRGLTVLIAQVGG